MLLSFSYIMNMAPMKWFKWLLHIGLGTVKIAHRFKLPASLSGKLPAPFLFIYWDNSKECLNSVSLLQLTFKRQINAFGLQQLSNVLCTLTSLFNLYCELQIGNWKLFQLTAFEILWKKILSVFLSRSFMPIEGKRKGRNKKKHFKFLYTCLVQKKERTQNKILSPLHYFSYFCTEAGQTIWFETGFWILDEHLQFFRLSLRVCKER